MDLNLLIADDHSLFNEGLKALLKANLGANRIDTATNGKEAIQASIKNDYDFVLLDIRMPVIDGIEVCAEIKRIKPATKIIIISMSSELQSIYNSISAGADAYVFKGNGLFDIIDAIKCINHNDFFISEQFRHLIPKKLEQIKKETNPINESGNNLISARELMVLKLIAEGYKNEEIANQLNISARTVDTHRANMLSRLKLPNTAALIRFAMQNKIID
jgi:DNA-binding NarL/FixJ family response regulator